MIIFINTFFLINIFIICDFFLRGFGYMIDFEKFSLMKK